MQHPLKHLFMRIRMKLQVGAAKITAMLRQDGLIRGTEVYLSSGEVHLGMSKSRNGEDPA